MRGHSMGGAIAALALARLRAEAPWASRAVAYTVGTPAALSLNLGRRLAEEGAVLTAVNGRDWSPRSSVSGARELVDGVVGLGVVRSVLRGAVGRELGRAPVESPEAEQLPPGRILQVAGAALGEREWGKAGPWRASLFLHLPSDATSRRACYLVRL